MSKPCLKVEGLTKTYKLFDSPAHKLKHALFPTWVKPPRLKDAVKDISFSAHKGEVVGIVGANGSGKSTLLKCIAGRIEGSSGKVEVDGRVAPIIELGAGFNQEATGEENIYNFGAVLGMSNAEISDKFTEIVGFCELGMYIHQPVKTYSSGMKARLAFSVASHVDADLIILDEVLAVGDRAFRAKCARAIGRLVGSGACILLVSHDTDTIVNLCSRAIEISDGQLVADGEPRDVVRAYEKRILGGQSQEDVPSDAKVECDKKNSLSTSWFSDEVHRIDLGVKYQARQVEILTPHFLNSMNERINIVETGDEIYFRHNVQFSEALSNVNFGMQVRDADGVLVSGASTHMSSTPLLYAEQGSCYEVNWQVKANLSPGLYFFTCGVQFDEGEGREFAARCVDVVALKVRENASRRSIGIANLEQLAVIKQA